MKKIWFIAVLGCLTGLILFLCIWQGVGRSGIEGKEPVLTDLAGIETGKDGLEDKAADIAIKGSEVFPKGDLQEEGDRKSVKEQTTVAVRVLDRDQEALISSGSGVVYEVSEERAWIVTAAHVLKKAPEGYPVCVAFGTADVAGLAREIQVRCQQYRLSEDTDLAFLCVWRDELPLELWDLLRAGTTDKEKFDALRAGDSVYVRGYGEDEIAVSEGSLEDTWVYVEDFAQYLILARCNVEPGMSGGGLYDEAGNLIGVVCGRNEQGELAAVPLHVIQAEFVNLVRD